ncbi:MAG: glutamine synthetase [Chloroflexi bacterium]|nr:glutamine synthetase [Chloroflexota bacterium]
MTTTPPQGMLTLDELSLMVDSGEIETVVAAFPDLYGRLMGKRITGKFFIDHTARKGMHACDYLFTVDMEMEPVPGYAFANWELGYGDVHLIPDLNTLRRATWLDKTAFVLCDVHDERDETPVAIAPRNILKRQMAAAAAMGYVAQGSSELEYYIFDESYESARQAHYQDLKTYGAYIEDYHILQGRREEVLHATVRRHLDHSGVPVEFSKGEWGPGQHELNIRYADLLTMADRHIIYKQCFKDVADDLGLAVTFMAKYDASLAGSSCHMHVSLWDAAGERNLFAGEEKFGPVHCSKTFRRFLGGWMAHARELMVFYAPTVNSYKRYQAGSWAPTSLAWSYDNRTAGFRVVGHGQSLRIESRIAGADVNPYLAYAAILASGLDGIRNGIEPPPAFEGDVYAAADLPHVPRTLHEAIAEFERSEFARAAFGDEVVEHYLHFFKTEQAAFDRAVTDWERKRYFEQI